MRPMAYWARRRGARRVVSRRVDPRIPEQLVVDVALEVCEDGIDSDCSGADLMCGFIGEVIPQ